VLLSALGAVHSGAGAVRAAAPARRVMPFIADDYARGVAEARARKVPLFIESWAPW
jgi:NAD(P)H-hydrate repair Nnr-like enzyme with NAD(P)H-hydrate dehydratase domain